MKEEAPTKKKLPPKMNNGAGEAVAAASTTTPTTKVAHDEILSSLLRINNFDSISSIKDESLDIDLSACVTISPAGLVNSNSLSSTDFWRVLDESAQNAEELNLSEGKEDLSTTPTNGCGGGGGASNESHSVEFLPVTFLRPEPPNAFTNSPFKKSGSLTPVKQLSPMEQQHIPVNNNKIRLPIMNTVRLKVFKEEPFEDQQHSHLIGVPSVCLESKSEVCDAELISSAFNIFQQPKESAVKAVTKPVDSEPSLPEIKVLTIHKCLDCNGLVLSSQPEVATHESAAHRIRLFYKCGECEREFDLLTGLKKHLKTHRNEGRKDTWKKCPDCGKCLKLGSMWMHRKIHTDNKKYVCDICGQKFVQKVNLTHHARIHSSEKPYECPECQKRFQERSHLQRHQKYHAQTRSYRCEKCGKMYKTERCLKVHNLVHLEQRPFACNVCEKSFISNSKLKQHSNIHTGMRPFKCNYCPRDFTNFPNWLKHTRRRHKVDHKTGEHLENIPSYCSKKSTSKTQKAAAAATAAAEAAVNEAVTDQATVAAPTIGLATTSQSKPALNPNGAKPNAVKQSVKIARKKKQAQPSNSETMPSAEAASPALKELQQQQQQKTQTAISTTAAKRNVPNSEADFGSPVVPPLPKQTKVKRERKQLTPKQLQKLPLARTATVAPTSSTHPQSVTSNILAQIKKEPICGTKTPPPLPAQFLDLHGLSLTSAEELIMEQALEMEECGLYDTPAAVATDLGNDNAISSETAAALHFQIKSEVNDDKDEERFVTLKKNERLACPSLESSPYSSPASIELACNGSGTSTRAANVSATSNYYMPTFSLNAQGAIVTGLGLSAVRSVGLAAAAAAAAANGVKINTATTTTAQLTTTAATTASTAGGTNGTATLLNVPLLVRHSQMQPLPSVDTLLFATNANTRFFAGGKANVSAPPNLSSS